MTVTTRKFTFEEYLAYDDNTGSRYELVDGELLATRVGTGLHGAIAEFLNDQFKAAAQQNGKPWTAKDMRIGIRSPRSTRWDTSRIPDVVVLPIAQWEARNCSFHCEGTHFSHLMSSVAPIREAQPKVPKQIDQELKS